ncbi:MAG TPA: hypothetical protein DCY20_10275 [Firmicutes bacterium]|nr:hypothetical protein [Bacillota bacterium]
MALEWHAPPCDGGGVVRQVVGVKVTPFVMGGDVVRQVVGVEGGPLCDGRDVVRQVVRGDWPPLVFRVRLFDRSLDGGGTLYDRIDVNQQSIKSASLPIRKKD